MDQPECEEDDSPVHALSPKLATKFLEVISSSLSELSLNSNHLGSCWIERLVDLLINNTSLKYLSLAILDLTSLTVENALKLAKAIHRNRDLIQFE